MLGDLVHEEAVVRDDEHAAREVLQILLQSLQREDVEVVGRLVEDEEVGAGDEDRAEIETTQLSSAELLDGGVLALGREEEARQNLRGAEALYSTACGQGEVLR